MYLLKGLFVSLLLLLIIGSISYFSGIRALSDLGTLIIIIPIFPVFGLILGYAGTKIQTKRFKNLFILALILTYLGGLFLAVLMMFTDTSANSRGFFYTIYSIFMLGTAGFFLYGTLLIPFHLLGVYLLERWTRPDTDVKE